MTTQPKTVTLQEICKQHKLCPRISRMLLREAAKDDKKHLHLAKLHKPRTAWIWPAGSKSLEEALAALKPVQQQKTAS